MDELQNNMLIFYTGVERKASSVLSEQAKTITKNENDEDSYETVSEDAILNALNSDTSLTEK